MLLSLPESALRSLLGGHLRAWAGLLPDLGEALGVTPGAGVSGDLARRRAFDAVVAAIAGLATRQPVLLTVDDLQYGADVTADVLAHLASQLGPAPVLLVGATRTEGLPALSALTAAERAGRAGSAPPVGRRARWRPPPGSPGAATRCWPAARATRSAWSPASTRSRPGPAGVPHSVATAVAGQLDRLDPDGRGGR